MLKRRVETRPEGRVVCTYYVLPLIHSGKLERKHLEIEGKDTEENT